MCCETDFLSYVEQATTNKFQVVVVGHWQDAQLCKWNLCGEPGSLRQVDKQEWPEDSSTAAPKKVIDLCCINLATDRLLASSACYTSSMLMAEGAETAL